MKYLFVMIVLVSGIFWGCEPLSVVEPPRDRDVVADVVAFISPDTVQQNVRFTVHIGYPNICGGSYKYTYVTIDTFDHVFIQPVLHQDPQDVCPEVITYGSLAIPITLTKIGQTELVAIGNFGTLRKMIVVVGQHTSGPNYSFRFSFENRQGVPYTERAFGFNIENQSSFPIQTDSDGYWDTTFTSTASELSYQIAGVTFTAKRGIPEYGMIIRP